MQIYRLNSVGSQDRGMIPCSNGAAGRVPRLFCSSEQAPSLSRTHSFALLLSRTVNFLSSDKKTE